MPFHSANAIVAVLLALLLFSGPLAARAQPNIVLIIGDDQGWTDYGFMPSSRTLDTRRGTMPLNEVVQTPRLDALAREGVVFTNAHTTASICLPSLRTLLTSAGLQPLQWADKRRALANLDAIDLPDNRYQFFRLEVEHYRTLPRDLSRAGYQSWQGGKYWESTFERGGFDRGLAQTDGSFMRPDGWDFGRAGWDPARCGPGAAPGASCPALDPLRAFLDEAAGGPFFVWFAPQLPHNPFDAPQNFRDRYEELGLTTCAQEDCEGHCIHCPNEVNYLSNIAWFDALVGELVDELEQRGLRDDTLLIYLSDNGWGLNMQLFAGTGQGKGTLFEMGFRTPMIFNWPGRIPAGAAYDDLVSSTDVAPTILDYAGLETLPEQQGVSLRRRIEGSAAAGRTELIGYQPELGHFLRTDSWRYLRFADDGREALYRIDIDPFESNDLAAQHPGLVGLFSSIVNRWESERRRAPAQVELTGRVLDAESGAAAAGSQLRLEGGTLSLVSIVGEDGGFRFGPLAAGEYNLRADARLSRLRWLTVTEPVPVSLPLASGGAYMELTARQRRALDTPAGSQIRGRLTDSAGQPLAGVPILVEGALGCEAIRAQTLTLADGSYRTENLPFATYTVTAKMPAGQTDVVLEAVAVDSLSVVTRDLVARPQ